MNTFKGSRWYKCDFHLHTHTSKCFEDEDKTLDGFIDKVIEEKLECIAITDHNAGGSIDGIKLLAADKGITVFPGVEITCSDAKIHLLVLFDTDKGTQDIEDYLLSLEVKREDFGAKTAHVHKEVHEVITHSYDFGAIVIPAHIDSYSGLSKVSEESKKKIFGETNINAVQIVHEELIDPEIKIDGNINLLNHFQQYYNDDKIDISQIKEWGTCSNYIKECALLTFSDNLSHEKSSKHGIWGIGNKYTWIKMNEKPNLESLRQALLLPELRIRNYYESQENPYCLPKIWIKNIRFSDTILSEKNKEVIVNFSPQMSTIIGGRGSGKSSIINLLRGVFNKSESLNDLENIENEFMKYYKINDSKKKGVFTDKSEVVVEIVMNKILYKITATDIKECHDQNIIIEKWDSDTKDFTIIENNEYLKLFNFDIYSQKQIYEIAQSPNALRERIDNAIPDIKNHKRNIVEKESEVIRISSQIHEGYKKLEDKRTHEAKFEEISSQINSYNESGISELLNDRKNFINDKEKLTTITKQLIEKTTYFEELKNQLSAIKLDSNEFSEKYKQEFKTLFALMEENINRCITDIQKSKEEYRNMHKYLQESIMKLKWKIDYTENQQSIDAKKIELGKKGVEDISGFEKLLGDKERKFKEIQELKEVEEQISKNTKIRKNIYKDILSIRLDIFNKRNKFLSEILKDKNVKIKVRHCRDEQSFKREVRSIIQKSTEFEVSINNLVNKAFEGKLPENLIKTHKDLKELRKGNVPEGYDGYFRNFIMNLNNEQFEKLILLIPEDEIFAEYRTTEKGTFKSISNASAGQKTATILTFILAYGESPLILDQPEDDLDNRLVYGLIVDRLRESKENRQIIVVTHNANIPVNGDSEYITAMDSSSNYLKVLCDGTIEEAEIRNEICEVMEGGEIAFNLRAKRYNL